MHLSEIHVEYCKLNSMNLKNELQYVQRCYTVILHVFAKVSFSFQKNENNSITGNLISMVRNTNANTNPSACE